MSRFLAGGIAAMLMVAGGLFWWQSRAGADPAPPAPYAAPVAAADLSLPEGDEDAVGDAPPMPASATPATREARRFQRYDRNRDGAITRVEMLSTRTPAFKKLDKDGDNLLSFEEWAAATGGRFDGADADRNGRLNPGEFATTAPKRAATARCAC